MKQSSKNVRAQPERRTRKPRLCVTQAGTEQSSIKGLEERVTQRREGNKRQSSYHNGSGDTWLPYEHKQLPPLTPRSPFTHL